MIKHYNLLWVFLAFIAIYLICLPDYSILHGESKSSIVKRDTKNGTITTYHPNGNPKTIIGYNKGVKDGKAYLYYSSGSILLEMNYENGRREGYSKKFYESGELYASTPYINHKIRGLREVYYESGQLKALVPYWNNRPGLGLKEYTQNGELKELPKMEVKFSNDSTEYQFRIDHCFKERFYLGRLENGYLIPLPTLVSPLPSREGFHYLSLDKIKIPEFNIICECKTTAGFPYVSQIKITPEYLGDSN
ncbi:MAG: hypothetical protein RIC35_14615 [Marinoscillum sp.]